jgi:hypothetical protein
LKQVGINLGREEAAIHVTLRIRGKYRYGDNQADIREEIARYSALNAYIAHHFADSVCNCGSHVFRLLLDDAAGAAVRRCASFSAQHPIGDSKDYLEDADSGECACPC